MAPRRHDRQTRNARRRTSRIARLSLLLAGATLALQPASGVARQQPIRALAPVEIVTEGLREATGVAVDEAGTVFVTDRVAGKVIRIEPTGRRTVVARSLNGPVGLAFDAEGHLLVAEEQAGRILRLEANGARRPVARRLHRPRWLATDERGTLFVAASGLKPAIGLRDSRDVEEDVVIAVTPDGAQSVFARGFDQVEGLAADDGVLYVAGRGGRGRNIRSVVVSAIPLLPGARSGAAAPYATHEWLVQPRGVAVDRVGALFLAAHEAVDGRQAPRTDARSGPRSVIAKGHPDGTLTYFASNLEAPAEGLAFDAQGNLYVAEGRGGRVLRFRAPAAPVISAPRLTRDRVVRLSGTTEAEAVVEVYLEGASTPLRQVADPTGAFAVDVTLTPNTENHLYVAATAAGGRGLTSALTEAVVVHDDVAPSLVFTSPAEGATLREPVRLEARASDAGSRVVAMAFSVGATPLATTTTPALPAAAATASASWDTTRVTGGAYTLIAVATDEAGNVASVSRNVLVETRRPPALAVSATAVAPGAKVTASLTNGPGSAGSWLALAATGAPNTSFVQSIMVPAGTTAMSWTVTMPPTPGGYEFRLLLGDNSRAATSPTVTVLSGVNPVPTLNALVPARTPAGGPSFSLLANGANFAAGSVVRWNGVDLPTTVLGPNQLRAAVPAAHIAAVGSAQVTVFTPGPGGGTSDPVRFDVTPPPTLRVDATTVRVGASVTVTLSNGLGGEFDWLALAPSTAPNTVFLNWTYVGRNVTTRTWTVTMPTTPGTYDVRLFLDNGFVRAATSPTVTVTP